MAKEQGYEAYLEKARYWCAREERSTAETKRKLKQLGMSPAEVEKAVAWLIKDNYLNEERFARAYAEGHVRIKGWGPQKIRAGLFARGVDGDLIHRVLTEIEDSEWHEALKRTLEMASRKGYSGEDYASRMKLLRFAAGRGFDGEAVEQLLK